MNKKAFTLIELLIIVAIIAILATAILVTVSQSRKNARINSVKTSMRTVLPAIIACIDAGEKINIHPVGNQNGTAVAGEDVCLNGKGLAGAKWPALPSGYSYDNCNPGNYTFHYLLDSNKCSFVVCPGTDKGKDANGVGINMVCSCTTQQCK